MCFARLPYNYADDINEQNENIDLLREEIIAWAGFDDEVRRGRTDLPNRMYSFLKRLLAVNPDERPTTGEILHSLRSPTEMEDEPQSPVEERQGTRISPLESPSPHSRRNTLQSRPTLAPKPTVTRTNRSVSPLKSPVRNDKGEDVSAVIVRARSTTRSRPTSPTKEALPLALPPPPPSAFDRVMVLTRFLPGKQTVVAIKLGSFTLKFLSLSNSCRPMAARPAIALPCMMLGAMDLLWIGRQDGTGKAFAMTIILGLLHFLALTVASRMGVLCDAWA
jgi:serine/threonine protein kinase